MASDKENLENYLECERLFAEFFREVDYCVPNCITQEKSKYGHRGHNLRGDVGCCCADFYKEDNSFHGGTVLARVRTNRYGLPENQEEPINEYGARPCSYHTSDGCILKDHKPVVCVTYMCVPMRTYIHDNFGFWLPEKGDLGWELRMVVNGSKNGRQLRSFKGEIQSWTETVRQKKAKRFK